MEILNNPKGNEDENDALDYRLGASLLCLAAIAQDKSALPTLTHTISTTAPTIASRNQSAKAYPPVTCLANGTKTVFACRLNSRANSASNAFSSAVACATDRTDSNYL